MAEHPLDKNFELVAIGFEGHWAPPSSNASGVCSRTARTTASKNASETALESKCIRWTYWTLPRSSLTRMPSLTWGLAGSCAQHFPFFVCIATSRMVSFISAMLISANPLSVLRTRGRNSRQRIVSFACAGGGFRVLAAGVLSKLSWTLAPPAPGFAFGGGISRSPTRVTKSDTHYPHISRDVVCLLKNFQKATGPGCIEAASRAANLLCSRQIRATCCSLSLIPRLRRHRATK